MHETLQTLLFLFAVLAVVAIAAKRLQTAPSILLVAAGVGLAIIPGLPKIELAPEMVLLVFLPPLIYSAGVAMSWREFRFNLRPIGLLAVGCVVFTAVVVAFACEMLLGIDWRVGFLLGAIVAPPDVVAPLTLAKRLHLPKRLLVILEGEGLVNDATALILYRFAVVAIATGAFSLPKAAGTFAAIVVCEILFGIAIAYCSLHVRRWARETRVEITLSLMTPYLAYWVPEHLGGSGVLATVAAGLFTSWHGPRLISSATRLQGIFFWDLIVYLIEGLVFLLTGLQARLLIERINSGAVSLNDLLIATALVAVITIAARFVWIYPATYIPRWISPSLAKRDPSPNWKTPFLLGFTGVRGVVSLAAALALPLTLANGQPFPHRDLILFVTFGVIVITLVGQGLMLPAVVRWLRLSEDGRAERWSDLQSELHARQKAIEATRRKIGEIAQERQLHEEVVAVLEARFEDRLRHLPRDFDEDLQLAKTGIEIELELIGVEREFLLELAKQGGISDESRRRIEHELDLEEAAIANRSNGQVSAGAI